MTIFAIFLIISLNKLKSWKYYHDIITKTAKKRFKRGEYADAITAVFKEMETLLNEVNKRRGLKTGFGKQLIEKLFRIKDEIPAIKFNNLISEDEKDLQETYTNIFKALFSIVRNPLSHINVDIDKNDTLTYIHLQDYLLKLLNNATIQCSCGDTVKFFDYIKNHKH